MKNFIIGIFVLAMSPVVQAQDVFEGVQSFMRNEEGNALSVDLMGQKKNIEDVLEKKFKMKTGMKSRSRKGVKAFEMARMLDISSRQLDYYYTVENKKGINNTYTVRLFIKDGNKFLNTETYPEEVDAAREILENLQYETTVYEFELAINEQHEILNEVIENHRKMVEDSIKLDAKMDDLLKDMENSRNELQEQIVKIEQERLRLEAFKEEMDEYIRKGSTNENMSRGNN